MSLDKVLAKIPLWLKEFGIPGASLASVADGKVRSLHSYGVKNAETDAPVDIWTVFEAASLSKQVFAHLVLLLCADGLLNLDTPLINYLAEPYYERLPGNGAPGDGAGTVLDAEYLKLITPRMVLSHTTGLPNWRSPDKPLQFYAAPGARYAYSGEGFMCLQKVVEGVTGQSLQDVARARIFEPLGMAQTSFTWRPNYEKEAAAGHDKAQKPLPFRRYDVGHSAGSLYGTPQDYARFITAVLDSPVLEQMPTPQIQISERLAWGVGWGIAMGDENILWQWGNNDIYWGFTALVPTRRSGFVILLNSENSLPFLERFIPEIEPALAPVFTDFLPNFGQYRF
jgi:CubicO group peptidase (beta-lactamase class C family)